MGVAELLPALPTNDSGGPPNKDLLRAELTSGMVGFIAATATRTSVDPVDAQSSAVRQAYVLEGAGVFVYDSADGTTADDGLSCIVLSGGKRYKVVGSILLRGVIESATAASEPSPSAFGQQWIDIAGVWGTANSIQTWISAAGGPWNETAADYLGAFYVKDEAGFRHWNGASWVEGFGATAYADDSIPLSALIGFAASLIPKVVNQTTYAPPGSRVAGGTPTMPLGGTASAINDDSTATTAVTGALGDLTAAAVAGRIVARITYAAAKDLIAIEAKDVLGTAASSSTACGLYYSTDSGANWTQAGAGFTLATTAADVLRTGTFNGVTDIAVVVEAKAWSTNTATLADLNGHDATVTGTLGDGYVVAANGFGIFAGKAGQYARCELADTYTFYVADNGDELFDQALNQKIQWQAAQSAWISASGVWVDYAEAIATAGANAATHPADPGATYSFSPTTAPDVSTKEYTYDTNTISFAANVAGARLRLRWRAAYVDFNFSAYGANRVGANTAITIGVRRDSESALIAWSVLVPPTDINTAGTGSAISSRPLQAEFLLSASDDSAHTYTVVFMVGVYNNGSSDVGHFVNTIYNSVITVEEKAN